MNRSIPKYQQIARDIIQGITTNKLRAGEKMPSLRQLSQQRNTSITTAIRCYEYLQDHGYLVALPRSGFIVQSDPTANSSSKDKGAAKSIFLPQFSPQVRTRCLVPKPHKPQPFSDTSPSVFASAQIAPELLPIQQLNRCITRMQKYNQGFLYGEPAGEKEFREQVSQHFSQQGLPISSEHLLVTNGCMDAVSHALELLTTKGDIVAINSPCYYGLIQLLGLMQRKIIEIPSTVEGLDLDALARASRKHDIKACVFNTNHQNPSGGTLAIEQKQWLAKFANQQKIPLIEDDVFIDLSHTGCLPLPVKYWDSNGYVIWCSSVSKTLAPGLRLGWCDAGRFSELLQSARRLKSIGVNRPLQQGLAEFFRNGHYRRHLSRLAPTLGAQIQDYQNYLTTHLPEGSAFSLPCGGSTLWIQVPNLKSKKLQNLTQGCNSEVVTGSFFSSRAVYDEYFRLNAGWPLEGKVKAALKALLNNVKQAQLT